MTGENMLITFNSIYQIHHAKVRSSKPHIIMNTPCGEFKVCGLRVFQWPWSPKDGRYLKRWNREHFVV